MIRGASNFVVSRENKIPFCDRSIMLRIKLN